ncbi:MAG: hypothetical protein QGF00_06380 [Planctomycetota bacterium]|jgi:hypothetical protein|nr:hypothetical protein [Planctomycetota bacterium]MDP7249210.1 hypothetical protein [Planctomycetota bacterium]
MFTKAFLRFTKGMPVELLSQVVGKRDFLLYRTGFRFPGWAERSRILISRLFWVLRSIRDISDSSKDNLVFAKEAGRFLDVEGFQLNLIRERSVLDFLALSRDPDLCALICHSCDLLALAVLTSVTGSRLEFEFDKMGIRFAFENGVASAPPESIQAAQIALIHYLFNEENCLERAEGFLQYSHDNLAGKIKVGDATNQIELSAGEFFAGAPVGNC